MSWFDIAVAALGAYSESRDRKEQGKDAHKYDKENTAQQGIEARRTVQYSADLDDYYKQLEKDRKKKALYSYVNMAAPSDLMGAKPEADKYPQNSPLLPQTGG